MDCQVSIAEDDDFLSKQIITYLGNKRGLLKEINEEICHIKEKLSLTKVSCADLFSGSGIVARLLKQHATELYVNDLEEYSRVLNECYLSNKSMFDIDTYDFYRSNIQKEIETNLIEGIITQNYAPMDEKNILIGERVFYTRKNAMIIDTIRKEIEKIPSTERKYFLAPLLYEASVHVNTAGIFKGFYKDSSTGIGKYGGTGENALYRIKGEIELQVPIFSKFECDCRIYQEDTNSLIKKLPSIDIAYIDPPYNQHPYGSNYFMLNLIVKNKIEDDVSRVSGIPIDWNRSLYNKKSKALGAFEELIRNLKTKYAIISYNSEGHISLNEMKDVLSKYGKVKVREIKYNTYRGSRNLSNRNLYVSEYLFVLQKENS